jgi:hypothetical protein
MAHAKTKDKSSLRHDASDHFRLVMADDLRDLELQLKITQEQAVTDLIEHTSWGDGLPQFRSGKGTSKERRDALRAAHDQAFAKPVFTYPNDPHPALNRENTDWDSFDDQIIKIAATLRPAIDQAIARVKADFNPQPSMIIQYLFMAAMNTCFEAEPDDNRRAYDMFEKIAEDTPDLHSIPSRLTGHYSTTDHEDDEP